MSELLETTAAAVVAVDDAARADALARHARLAKPAGSLGRVEALGAQLCAIAGRCPPPTVDTTTVVVFAGDHGVVASGVTTWPQAITTAMVETFASGRAAVNAIARQVGAGVVVVDVGVATPPSAGAAVDRNVRRGTRDLAVEAAMTVDEADRAIDVGIELAAACVTEGARCLVTGDMGIGNTTPSAALVAAFAGGDPRALTGRGTGIDDSMLEHKARIVGDAVARTGGLSPIEVLAEVGGLEIAALSGFVIGGAAARVPVVVDGVIALAAAVVATALVPVCAGYLIAGHRSVEPAASVALDHLGLVPLLDLGLHLGEGTGALLAVPIVRAAAAVLNEVATLDEL